MPNAVEEAAIKWVIDYEKSKGRTAVDTRKRKGASTDIESPPLSIEVRAFGKICRGEQLWLEPAQYREATANPNFRLYVVESVTQGPITLRIIAGEQLAEMVRHATHKDYYLLPWFVTIYDKMPVERLP